MKQLIASCISMLIISISWAQSPILLEIENDKISLEEFDLVYNKNNGTAQAIDPKTKEEYLEMYINFKLKVKEAMDAGLDTSDKFIRELSGYRKQLAAPYLVDQQVTDSLVKEAYQRMQNDVNAYHILISVPESATPQDTLEAYNNCKKIIGEIKDPANEFESMAKKYSKDPSAASNGGNLGYFNVFQMVYPFESAAYNTPVGQLSDPIRTRFGYHVVYVKDKRPARGEIQVAHIMVRLTENESPAAKEKKALEIYDQIKGGKSFEEMANLHSDDRGSAAKGGKLPMFGTGRMVRVFEDAAFALENDGDISKPVKTRYGWHIIKRIEKKDIPTYDKIKDELKTKVKRDGRGVLSKEVFVEKLKQEYKFKANAKVLADLASKIDQSYSQGNWVADSVLTKGDKVAFSVMDKNYKKEKASWTQRDLALFIQNSKSLKRVPQMDSNEIVNKALDQFVEQELIKFEDARLEAKHVKFRSLMQEYHDGILLFDLMDKKVWSKAVKDSSGLEAFYNTNKENYKWEQRTDAYLFLCNNAATAEQAKAMVKQQTDTGKINTKVLMETLNKNSQLALTIKKGPFEKGENKLIDELAWKTGFSDFKVGGNSVTFSYTAAILEPGIKGLNETRGAAISDYQTQLEDEWIKELRAKYTVTVHKEVLK